MSGDTRYTMENILFVLMSRVSQPSFLKVTVPKNQFTVITYSMEFRL